MPHVAAKVNMLIDTDVDTGNVTGSRPLMGHCVYESFVLSLLCSNRLNRQSSCGYVTYVCINSLGYILDAWMQSLQASVVILSSWPTCCVKCGRLLALTEIPPPPCPLLSAFRLTPPLRCGRPLWMTPKLCVKFEWSIIKHCKKYLTKCEITNLVTRSGELSGCGQRAWPKTKGSCDLATLLLEHFLRGHVRTVPGNTHVKFELRSFNCIGDISIYAQKFRGHVTRPFLKNFKKSCPDCAWKHARQIWSP